jgi:hypothetical protein
MHEYHPKPELVVASIARSENSFSQNQPIINIKSSSSLKIHANEKGKKPIKESYRSKTFKPASIHSKSGVKESKGEYREDILV